MFAPVKDNSYAKNNQSMSYDDGHRDKRERVRTIDNDPILHTMRVRSLPRGFNKPSRLGGIIDATSNHHFSARFAQDLKSRPNFYAKKEGQFMGYAGRKNLIDKIGRMNMTLF